MEKDYYKKEYPNLWQFLGFSFHQDWSLDYKTADEPIQDFIITSSMSFIIKVYLELIQLLKEEHKPEEWEIIIMDKFGVDYDYTSAQDMGHMEWLQWLRERMLYHAQQELGLDLEELSNYYEQYSNLANFLSECFKYAWNMDYATPDDAIKGSIIEGHKLLIRQAYVELKQLLNETYIVEEWNFLIIECMGIRYDKASQDLDHKQWLEWVKGRMLYHAQVEKGLDLEKEATEEKSL